MAVDDSVMPEGPTQNYDDESLGRWAPHPALAVCVRALLLSFPALVAIAFGLAAVRWAPASRLGLDPWVWLAAEMLTSAAVLVLMSRLVRRLLPLSSLLRLTLYFPDRAPSRVAVALRHYSTTGLRDHLDATREGAAPLGGLQPQQTELLLDLVAAISAHDEVTRGHSERVQAYSALVGRELGLSDRDAAKLSWAALLHDVGKLSVPSTILNKTGRPTVEEWTVLATHPAAGMEIAAPLVDWLGPWLAAVGEHHERWDGGGYPNGLAGTRISLSARIVAVADAYDAITSARSYKKPLSASAAREELARCSGRQFDPEVVRAFLAISVGRLQVVAGFASVLSGLPGLGTMPVRNLASLLSGTTATASASTAVAIGVVGALLGVTSSAAGIDNAPAIADGGALHVIGSVGPGAVDGGDRAPGPAGAPAPASESAGSAASPATVPGAPRAPLTTPGPGALRAPGAGPADAPTQADPAADPAADSAPSAPAPAPLPPAPAPTAAVAAPSDTSSVDPNATPCEQARAGARSLRGAALQGCNLVGRTLTGDYAGANLSGAALTGATLVALDLSGADLSGANLDRATITTTSFDRAQLSGASLGGTTITRSSFIGASLTSQTLRSAILTDCVFE